uniref:Spectrin repeat containing nuclear envelope family member 3 n=1 Tax=Latimeria chalumnae TaxID=7897 RepID=H3ASJ0_LATCH
MTQLPQDEFDASMEAAHAWMHAIQERLKVNDNTQGPLAALEARLRETEKICNLQPEGKVKIEKALIKAEALLQCSEEDKKPMILSTLKDLKQKWEETITFITHCHSRIEWVWLHWREHLKAKKEFDLWIIKMRMTLEPDLEMQLGLKEKQWQLDHYVVQLNDISNQKEFLERIIEEAQAFSERTEDPIVPEEARNQMKTDYEDIKTKAQEKVKILAKIAEEHQDYQTSVTEFQKWLNATTEMLNQYTESIKATEFKNEKIKNLQELKSSVSTGEETLNNIDIQANAVMKNTSPLGADKIVRKQKELRRAWEALRDHCAQEEEAQQRILDSERMYMNQARQLESEVADFRKLVQKLRQQLETEGGEESEEELVALWKRYLDISSTLAAEEPRVERLKAQLKELFRFSHDASSVSDNLLSAIKEYQSVKGQAVKLSSGKESELRKLYQDPLREFQRWKPIAHNILESSADITDMAQICFFSQRVEALLSQSCRLKEQLALLQQRKDLLENIFGEEKAGILQTKIAEAAREREFLHNSLSQRSGRLQILASHSKASNVDYESSKKRLAAIRTRLNAEKLQPSLPAKRAQFTRLQTIQKDLLDCEAQIGELENLVHSSPSHIQRINQLSSECQALNRTAQTLIQQSEQFISEHEQLHRSLQYLEEILTRTRQNLEYYRNANGDWNIGNRGGEIERLLAVLPEKEVDLHQVEDLGQSVIKNTSPEGASHIQAHLKHLRELWNSLYWLKFSLTRSLIFSWVFSCSSIISAPQLLTLQLIVLTPSMLSPDNNLKKKKKRESLRDRKGQGDYSKLLKEFEEWLRTEDTKLTKILAVRASLSGKELKARREKLKELRRRVVHGQNLFGALLRSHALSQKSEDMEMEDLRYRWMLYKSKLKDTGDLSPQKCPERPFKFKKKKKRTGKMCSFLYRVCWAALPLQLLLLLLLLLAFLLPLMEESHSCTLANNFARSFNIMLKYEGPPPT